MSDTPAIPELFSTTRFLGSPDAAAALRTHQPALPVTLPTGGHMWVLSRHEIAVAMLRDTRFRRESPTRETDIAPTLPLLSALDAPDHNRLRRLIGDSFSAARMADLRGETEQQAEALFEHVRTLPAPVDLYRHYCLPLAMRTTARVTGLPAELHDASSGWTRSYLAMTSYPAERAHRSAAGHAAVIDRALELVRANPGSDVLSDLIAAREAGRIDEDELRLLAASLHVTGHVKLAAQLAVGILLLLRTHATPPDAERSEVDATTEEILRFAPVPQNSHLRYVVEPMRWRELTLEPGDQVVASIFAANRDEAVFADPDEFRPRRSPNPHLTFSHGRHFCPGAMLTRMTVSAGISAVLPRLERLRLAGALDSDSWIDGLFARGLTELPVSIDAPVSSSKSMSHH